MASPNPSPNPKRQKPTTHKYTEYQDTAPRTGAVPFFNDPLNESTNDSAWKAYRDFLQRERRTIADKLAATEQASSRRANAAQTDLHVLKSLADELGVENDIAWDGTNPADGLPFVSQHNPWLDQPAEVKRAKTQSLLSRISNALRPRPEGNGQQGDGDGKSKNQGGEGQTPQGHSAPTRRSSSVPKEKESNQEWEPYVGGGGEQRHDEHTQESIFMSIRRLLQKLAEETDYSQVVENGRDRWDAKQLLVGRWNPTRIPLAKRDFATRIDHIYLSLDTSGSVDAYTSEIASMAAGAAGIVHLYTGTEGKPQYRVDRKEPLHSPNSPFPEWQNQSPMVYALGQDDKRFLEFERRFFEQWRPLYPALQGYCFELWVAWLLEAEKPKPGSRLLFWGDTRCVYIQAPQLLAHLVRKHRFAWLFPYARDYSPTATRYIENGPEWVIRNADSITDWEWGKLEAVGLPVLFEVKDAVSIQRAMRELQGRKSKQK